MLVSNKIIKSIKTNPTVPYLNSIRLDILKELLLEADKNYYNEDKKTESRLSDELYDLINDYVSTKDSEFIKQKLGNEAINITGTKVKLPVWMGSMDKKKTLLKDIEHVVVSDKLDGISCLVHLKPKMSPILYTRGNGEYGRNITHLVKYFNNIDYSSEKELIIRGELLLKTKTFNKYRSDESNPRNTVAGFVNSKEPDEKFKNHIDFIAYELIKPEGLTQSQQFDYLKNKTRNFKVVENEYFDTLDNMVISRKLNKRKNDSEYEIDGIIVTKNIIYENIKTGNPKHSFAYKENSLEKRVITTVNKIEWNVSKDGYLKPLVYFDMVIIDNVNIQKATGHNAKFIKDNAIGKGSKIVIERSGDVIPKIVSVNISTSADMPSIKYRWNKTNTDIIIDDDEDDDLKKKKFESILTTIKFEHLGKGIISKLYSNNIKSLKQLYTLTEEDIMKMDGFKKTSSENLYKSIQKRKKELSCLDYMVASNSFGRGLSKKNLEKIIIKYDPIKTNPTIENIENIDGLGGIYAKQYVESLPNFKKFLKENNLNCETDSNNVSVENASNLLKDFVVVFTGFRDKELENCIIKNGGKVSTVVNKKITHLIVKNIDEKNRKQILAKSYEKQILTTEKFIESLKFN